MRSARARSSPPRPARARAAPRALSAPRLPQVCVPLPPWAVRAGARKEIYFNPPETNVAIVTCGGLCPGLNDVVQGLVRKLEDYGVPEGNILGIKCAARPAARPARPVARLARPSPEQGRLAARAVRPARPPGQ